MKKNFSLSLLEREETHNGEVILIRNDVDRSTIPILCTRENISGNFFISKLYERAS